MPVSAAQLLRYLTFSKLIDMGTDRAEVRGLSILVMSIFFYQLAEPAMYVLMIEESLTYKIATLSHATWLIGAGFLAGALMMLPHLFTLVFMPSKLRCTTPRQLAGFAGLVGALCWGLLAFLSRNLDYEWVTITWVIRAVFDLWVATILGISLQAQQAREKKQQLQHLAERGMLLPEGTHDG